MLFHHSTDIWQLFDRWPPGPCRLIKRAPLFIYHFLLEAIKADGTMCGHHFCLSSRQMRNQSHQPVV